MVFGAAVAAIFTLFSVVNSAGSAVNISYEKEIVGEAVQNMKVTATDLRNEKVYTETDKLDRKIKNRIAEKLENTAKVLSASVYNTTNKQQKVFVHDAAKTTLMELTGRGVEDYLLTEVSEQVAKNVVKDVIVPLNIVTGVVDSAIMAKSAWGTDSGFQGKYFGQLARPAENLNLDMQIAQIKAQKVTKDIQKVNAELRQMMIDFGIDPDNPEGASDDDSSADTVGDDWDTGDDDWDTGDDDWDMGDDDWDDGSADDYYSGDYIDPYYGTDEWDQISSGLGFDPNAGVDNGDYYDGTGDDVWDDDVWDDDVYMPDPAAVDPGFYDDAGTYDGSSDYYSDPEPYYPEVSDEVPTPPVSDDSGGGSVVEPCSAGDVLCGLDVAL